MDGMKDAARTCLLRSAIKLAGAAVLLAGFFGVMLVFTPPPALTLAGILFGFLALTLGGVGDLRQSCRIAAFRGGFPNPPPPDRAPE